MDDMISRRAAIDALKRDEALVRAFGYQHAIDAVQALPSVQPEQSSEIQDILEYLDTVLHPIISPDHWNVYSELHDMISMLPSAQPEQIARDIATIIENERDMRVILKNADHTETHECVYRHTVTHDWIPVTEALPRDDEEVIVTCLDDSGDTPYSYTTVAWHYKGMWVCDNMRCLFVIAWMPLPEPYKERWEE